MNKETGLFATVYHIPVCPFSQRLKILLELRGLGNFVRFEVVDITKPRAAHIVALTGGSVPLPVMQLGDGTVLRESLVLLRHLDEALSGPPLRRKDATEHAIENMLIALEGGFANTGYGYVMNRDPGASESWRDRMFGKYKEINAFLDRYNPDGTYLFNDFGMAEAVFTPLMMRFWFLEYFEDFRLPETEEFARVRRWCDACMRHPAAQQVSEEEIVKLYYDYALGAGNGALVEGRERSSFEFEPHWETRPWPPRDKFGPLVSDADLGLV